MLIAKFSCNFVIRQGVIAHGVVIPSLECKPYRLISTNSHTHTHTHTHTHAQRTNRGACVVWQDLLRTYMYCSFHSCEIISVNINRHAPRRIKILQPHPLGDHVSSHSTDEGASTKASTPMTLMCKSRLNNLVTLTKGNEIRCRVQKSAV